MFFKSTSCWDMPACSLLTLLISSMDLWMQRPSKQYMLFPHLWICKSQIQTQKYQGSFILLEKSLLCAFQSRSSRDIRGFFWVLAVPIKNWEEFEKETIFRMSDFHLLPPFHQSYAITLHWCTRMTEHIVLVQAHILQNGMRVFFF